MNKIKILNAWGGEEMNSVILALPTTAADIVNLMAGLPYMWVTNICILKLKIPDVEILENGTSSQFMRLSIK